MTILLARTLCMTTLLGILTSPVCALAEVPAKAAIQFKQSAAEDDALMYRALAGFAFACVAAGGLAYGIKRFAPWIGNKARADRKNFLKKIETMRLTTRSTLFVIQYRNEELLVAESEKGVQILAGRTNGEVNTFEEGTR